MLMEYVPESIRRDMEADKVKALKDDAWKYFAESRDFTKSAESLQKALEIEPNDPDGHFNLAFLMRKVRRDGRGVGAACQDSRRT